MCTNGSSSCRGTPAKARRTGKPSPSSPLGAVVTERTGRSAASADGRSMRGSVRVSAVTAGTRRSNAFELADVPRHPFQVALLVDGERGVGLLQQGAGGVEQRARRRALARGGGNVGS